MRIFPLGANLLIRWNLRYSDDSIFPLSLYTYELSYNSNRGARIVADSSVATLEGNALVWTFRAEEQICGTYNLNLKIILSSSRIIELQYDNAFSLSPLAEYVNDGQEIIITSICDSIDMKAAVLQARKAMDLALEAKKNASNIIFERVFERGTDVGTITINGISKKIYVPDTVDWTKVLNKPELYSKSKVDELLADLADKEWVNSIVSSSISSSSASFRGTYSSLEELPQSGNKLNDYAYVTSSDNNEITSYTRYKYTAEGWAFEYTISNTTFSEEQMEALNSGITAELVAKIGSGGVGVEGYIGTTKVQQESGSQALTGISSIQLSLSQGRLEYSNDAWTLSDNLVVDGILSAGESGKTSSSGYVQAEWSDIKKLTKSEVGVLADAYAVKQAYEEAITHIANVPDWALKAYPELYVGKTKVHVSDSAQELIGIAKYFLEGAPGHIEYKSDAWSLSDNLVVNGFLAAGSSLNGGGAGYTQAEWSDIQKMQSSEDGCLASAYAIKEAYDAIIKTHVGKTKGTLIIGDKFFNGETDVTITTMDLGIPTWAMDEHLAFSSLPGLYIGKTKVQQAAKAQSLTGIQSILLENALGALLYSNDAWSLSDNLVVNGFLAVGSSGEAGSSGYTQAEWSDIKKLTKTEPGVLADAYAVKQAYEELTESITGKVKGVLTIGVKSYNGERDVTVTAADLGVSIWAMKDKLEFDDLPALYIGKSKVQSESKAQVLKGIEIFELEGAKGELSHDESSDAWVLDDSLVVGGFLAAGSSGDTGSSGYTQADLYYIKQMSEREDGVLADAFAMKEMYDELKTSALSKAQIDGIINIIF